jgi:hypothetical protein
VKGAGEGRDETRQGVTEHEGVGGGEAGEGRDENEKKRKQKNTATTKTHIFSAADAKKCAVSPCWFSSAFRLASDTAALHNSTPTTFFTLGMEAATHRPIVPVPQHTSSKVMSCSSAATALPPSTPTPPSPGVIVSSSSSAATAIGLAAAIFSPSLGTLDGSWSETKESASVFACSAPMSASAYLPTISYSFSQPGVLTWKNAPGDTRNFSVGVGTSAMGPGTLRCSSKSGAPQSSFGTADGSFSRGIDGPS